MTECGYIEKGFTTRAAAKRLGVGRHEVVRLIHAGKLDAQRTDSGAFVVSAASLSAYEKPRRAKGRPWSAETAWAALDLLGGGFAEWLDYQRRWRLGKKLRSIGAEELCWLARNRQEAKTYTCFGSMLDVVRDSTIATGFSACGDTLQAVGLAPCPSLADGYVRDGGLGGIVAKLCLVESEAGEATLRVAHGLPDKYAGLDEMPPAVVAADFAVSVDPRERRCGLEYLEVLLDEYREA